MMPIKKTSYTWWWAFLVGWVLLVFSRAAFCQVAVDGEAKALVEEWVKDSPERSEFVEYEAARLEVRAYVTDWTKNLPKRFRKRALSHVDDVAYYSLIHKVDPLLVSVIISLESSWNVKARGDLKEVGLMQVHSPKAKKGYDITSGPGQIEAGAAWLRYCIDQCGGNVRQGVNIYATGECKKPWSMLEYRMRKYRKAVESFRLRG